MTIYLRKTRDELVCHACISALATHTLAIGLLENNETAKALCLQCMKNLQRQIEIEIEIEIEEGENNAT